MTAEIHEFPKEFSEDTVAGTLAWASEKDLEAVAILGWTKDNKMLFGFSRLNSLTEKLGILEYAKMRLWHSLGEELHDDV